MGDAPEPRPDQHALRGAIAPNHQPEDFARRQSPGGERHRPLDRFGGVAEAPDRAREAVADLEESGFAALEAQAAAHPDGSPLDHRQIEPRRLRGAGLLDRPSQEAQRVGGRVRAETEVAGDFRIARVLVDGGEVGFLEGTEEEPPGAEGKTEVRALPRGRAGQRSGASAARPRSSISRSSAFRTPANIARPTTEKIRPRRLTGRAEKTSVTRVPAPSGSKLKSVR